MIYGSVCSGIEAATVAWHPLGWRPAFFAENDRFPSAVLQRHYPDVPNFGDLNRFKEWPDAAIDLLVGGTPCQSFSVAGLRKGLADPRGNITLIYLAIAARYRPRWLVWENVPGVLSDDKGRTFGTFLGGLAKLGYGFAYRVLDAQYFGLAQRRERVFVVGYLGDWRRAAAVLFERESLRGDPAPSRQAGQRPAGTLSARTEGGGFPGTDEAADGYVVPVSPIPILEAGARPGTSTDDPRAGMGVGSPGDPMYTLQAGKQHAVAHALRGEGFDASEDGTGRGTPLVPVAFNGRQDPLPGAIHGAIDQDPWTACVASVALRGRDGGGTAEMGDDLAGADRASQGGGDKAHVLERYRVRRLMTSECEKLQGFKPGYTDILYRGKPAADGPRYKAIGNSMATTCMAWIGRRIQMVEDMK